MITESAAYAVLSVVKSTMTYLYESGLWVGLYEDKTRHISIEIHFNLKPIPEVEQVTA